MSLKITALFVGLLLCIKSLDAQTKIIQLLDTANNESIADATLVVEGKTYSADKLGYCSINFNGASRISIQIKHPEYYTKSIQLDSAVLNNYVVYLNGRVKELKMATVSGSRFKKRVAEEVVSIEVIKPGFIQSNGINKMDEALNKAPGVTVIDNQINIRGGSGWSYGAGSRVLVLVDDMPLLTADAADAKWDFLPIENCEQVEVLKGAASALYGSAALNGVVNFRTAFAKSKPITKFQVFGGVYGNPKRSQLKWWGNDSTAQPFFSGVYISHTQKINNKTEFVFGAAAFKENSYLLGDSTNRMRTNFNLRHKVNERLSLGINFNLQKSKSSTFFLHVADSSLANLLQPYGGVGSGTTISKNNGTRFNVDPYLNYTSKQNWQHTLRGRYYVTNNDVITGNQSSLAQTMYAEYQVLKKFDAEVKGILHNSNLIGGAVSNLQNVRGDLYGEHKVHNMAVFAQVEKKLFDKLWLSGGLRYEMNKLDSLKREAKPVYRFGANYEVRKGTNLRASYGQGYRYPSIAERFIYTNFGAASVFPNPGLISETGESFELGVKQGLAISKWLGYFDLSLFSMSYKNMIEFNFGSVVYNQKNYIGFQSRNIGDTKINGIDVSLIGQGKIAACNVFLMAGYTYINAQQKLWDSTIRSNYSTAINFLKYRYKHSAKLSYEISYKKWSIAHINTYNSKMINIDEVFENNDNYKNVYGYLFNTTTGGLSSTIRQYRQKYNRGVLISDITLSYKMTEKYSMAFVVKNIANVETYLRPALINQPRNYTLQINARL